MERTRLGQGGPLVGRIGYGAMGLEGFYGGCEESSAVDALAYAMDRGLMIDTADAYGNGRNERLVAQAQKKCGQRPFVATKFGIVFEERERSTKLATGWGGRTLL
jgi:aryl-alcohol dehydrogenase-like predicted oxidoreductase